MTIHRMLIPQNLSPKLIFKKKIIPLFSQFKEKSHFPEVELEIETRKFVIKIAMNKDERQKSHDLRKKVFSSEFIGGEETLNSDWDKYDKKADFLIIIEKEENKVVGSYRLIRSLKPKKFYTSSEFFINNFISSPGTKVELSRACVAPKYRKGSVVLLLWKGIYNYLVKAKADILFGCSSLSSETGEEVLKTINFLESNGYTSDNPWNIEVKKKFCCRKKIELEILKRQILDSSSLELPPLFKSYLKIGAKMLPVPAYDSYYKCYDFFTILKVKDLKKIVSNKFSIDKN